MQEKQRYPTLAVDTKKKINIGKNMQEDIQSPHSNVGRLPYSTAKENKQNSYKSKFANLNLNDLDDESYGDSCTEFNAGQTEGYFDPTELDEYLKKPLDQGSIIDQDAMVSDMDKQQLAMMEKQQLRRKPPTSKQSSKLNLKQKTFTDYYRRGSPSTPKNKISTKALKKDQNMFKMAKPPITPKAGNQSELKKDAGGSAKKPMGNMNASGRSRKSRQQIEEEMMAELEATCNKDEENSSQSSINAPSSKLTITQNSMMTSKPPLAKKMISPVAVPKFDFSQFNFLENEDDKDNNSKSSMEHAQDQDKIASNADQIPSSSVPEKKIPYIQTKLPEFEKEIDEMAKSSHEKGKGFTEYFNDAIQDRERTIKEMTENQINQVKKGETGRKNSMSDKSLDHLLLKKFQFFRGVPEKEARKETPQEIIDKMIKTIKSKDSETNKSVSHSSKSNSSVTRLKDSQKKGKATIKLVQEFKTDTLDRLYNFGGKNDDIERINLPQISHLRDGIREVVLSIISGFSNAYFLSTSDYEVVHGNKIFVHKLRQDPRCHEALFGLGKLNFSIQMYDKAETYFKKAFKLMSDPIYKCWLGYTQLIKIQKLHKLIKSEQYRDKSITNLQRVLYDSFKSCAHNLERSASRAETEVYSNFGLLSLCVEARKLGNLLLSDKKQLIKEPEEYANRIRKVDQYMGYLSWAYLYFYLHQNQELAINVLKELIDMHQKKPEAYILLINFYLKKGYKSGFSVYADKMFLKCNQYQSFQERLMIVEIYALCLIKNNTPYRALYLLQLQYSKSPHYSVLLYQYAKMIIVSQQHEYFGSACSALQEALRTSIQKRARGIIYYLGYLAEQKKQYLQAYTYFKSYLDSGGHKSIKKIKYITQFMEMNNEQQLAKAYSIQQQITMILAPNIVKMQEQMTQMTNDQDLNLTGSSQRKSEQINESVLTIKQQQSLYAMVKSNLSPTASKANSRVNTPSPSRNGPSFATPTFKGGKMKFDFGKQGENSPMRTPNNAAAKRKNQQMFLLSNEKQGRTMSKNDMVTEKNMVNKCKELYYIDEKVGYLLLAMLQSDYYFNEDKAYKVYEKILEKNKSVDVYTQFFHFIRKSVLIDENKVEKWLDECLKLLESDQVDAQEWVMAHIQIAKLLFHMQGKKNFDQKVKDLTLINRALVCLLKLRYILPPIDQSLIHDFSMPIDFKNKYYAFNSVAQDDHSMHEGKSGNVTPNRTLSVISEGESVAQDAFFQQAINAQEGDQQELKTSIISLMEDPEIQDQSLMESKHENENLRLTDFTVTLEQKDMQDLFFSKSNRKIQKRAAQDMSFGPTTGSQLIDNGNSIRGSWDKGGQISNKLAESQKSKQQLQSKDSDPKLQLSCLESSYCINHHSKKSSILYFASPTLIGHMEQQNVSPKDLKKSQTYKFGNKQRSSMIFSTQMQVISSRKSINMQSVKQSTDNLPADVSFSMMQVQRNMNSKDDKNDIPPSDKTLDEEAVMQETKFCVYSDPTFLYVLGKACIQNKCYIDLALQSLQDYVMIAYYFRAFIGEEKYNRMRIKAILQIAKALLLLREPTDCEIVLSDIQDLINQQTSVPIKFTNQFNSIKKQAQELGALLASLRKQYKKSNQQEANTQLAL